jgi:hypothetical protein
MFAIETLNLTLLPFVAVLNALAQLFKVKVQCSVTFRMRGKVTARRIGMLVGGPC